MSELDSRNCDSFPSSHDSCSVDALERVVYFTGAGAAPCFYGYQPFSNYVATDQGSNTGYGVRQSSSNKKELSYWLNPAIDTRETAATCEILNLSSPLFSSTSTVMLRVEVTPLFADGRCFPTSCVLSLATSAQRLDGLSVRPVVLKEWHFPSPRKSTAQLSPANMVDPPTHSIQLPVRTIYNIASLLGPLPIRRDDSMQHVRLFVHMRFAGCSDASGVHRIAAVRLQYEQIGSPHEVLRILHDRKEMAGRRQHLLFSELETEKFWSSASAVEPTPPPLKEVEVLVENIDAEDCHSPPPAQPRSPSSPVALHSPPERSCTRHGASDVLPSRSPPQLEELETCRKLEMTLRPLKLERVRLTTAAPIPPSTSCCDVSYPSGLPLQRRRTRTIVLAPEIKEGAEGESDSESSSSISTQAGSTADKEAATRKAPIHMGIGVGAAAPPQLMQHIGIQRPTSKPLRCSTGVQTVLVASPTRTPIEAPLTHKPAGEKSVENHHLFDEGNTGEMQQIRGTELPSSLPKPLVTVHRRVSSAPEVLLAERPLCTGELAEVPRPRHDGSRGNDLLLHPSATPGKTVTWSFMSTGPEVTRLPEVGGLPIPLPVREMSVEGGRSVLGDISINIQRRESTLKHLAKDVDGVGRGRSTDTSATKWPRTLASSNVGLPSPMTGALSPHDHHISSLDFLAEGGLCRRVQSSCSAWYTVPPSSSLFVPRLLLRKRSDNSTSISQKSMTLSNTSSVSGWKCRFQDPQPLHQEKVTSDLLVRSASSHMWGTAANSYASHGLASISPPLSFGPVGHHYQSQSSMPEVPYPLAATLTKQSKLERKVLPKGNRSNTQQLWEADEDRLPADSPPPQSSCSSSSVPPSPPPPPPLAPPSHRALFQDSSKRRGSSTAAEPPGPAAISVAPVLPIREHRTVAGTTGSTAMEGDKNSCPKRRRRTSLRRGRSNDSASVPHPLPFSMSYAVWKHHVSRSGVGRRILTVERHIAQPVAANASAIHDPAAVVCTIGLEKVYRSSRLRHRTAEGKTKESICRLSILGKDQVEVLRGPNAYHSGAIHKTKVQVVEHCVVVMCNGQLVTAAEMDTKAAVQRVYEALLF